MNTQKKSTRPGISLFWFGKGCSPAGYLTRSAYKMTNITTSKEIIPWTCHVCGKKFDTSGVGICRKCNKATCMACFGLDTLHLISKIKKPEILICKTCSKSEDNR